MHDLFYNTQHSPVGAFASFTLGCRGGRGGLGLMQNRPAHENMFVGLESQGNPHIFEAMPFFNQDANTQAEAESFVADRVDAPQMDDHHLGSSPGVRLVPWRESEIQRSLSMASDVWRAGDMTLGVYSPRHRLPDPQVSQPDHDALKLGTCPAVAVELIIDNSNCDRPRRAFIGFQGSDAYSKMRQFEQPGSPKLSGVAQGRIKGIFTDHPQAITGQAFDITAVLSPVNPQNLSFGLGGVAAVMFDTPANTKAVYRLAVAFYCGGVVTTGQDAVFFYTRYFDRLESVAGFALAQHEALVNHAKADDEALDHSPHLNAAQKWQIAQAVHSYDGSTEFLDLGNAPSLSHQGRTPCWVVNEGEFRMMNTLDLTVDMMFYELRRHPWTVRNVLDRFIDRYQYTDQTHAPGDAETPLPGGVSFTHDQGVANHFSPPGRSVYEATNLSGCFSHMTFEQLVNFICVAGTYTHHCDDVEWLRTQSGLIDKCLTSMMNRDAVKPDQRNGIMGLDSSRTGCGAEITTYDSLDASLGQARNNTYLAVKGWSAYLLLERMLKQVGLHERSALAAQQARLACATVSRQRQSDGTLPAVLFEGQHGPIIPTIEGLIFPYVAGRRDALELDGPYAPLIAVLRTHIATVLESRVCLFPDGGWKLSSTSVNSWLSKIYLCQYIYREVLGFAWSKPGQASDDAHMKWLQNPEASEWAWSDQMHQGLAKGSRYYPRGVTSVLWLNEK